MQYLMVLWFILWYFFRVFGLNSIYSFESQENSRKTVHWLKSLHHVILVSCFKFFYCLYQLPKYGFSGFFQICGPFQLIGWLIQTSQNLSYSPLSMEVKKAKQTYFIQEQLPQLLLRSSSFSILLLPLLYNLLLLICI